MTEQKIKSSFLQLYSASVGTLISNPAIFFPFLVVMLLQFIFLELLYFFPQYPLNTIFAPIVSKIWAPSYMNFPLNFLLLPKMFQLVQIPVYIFINSFFIGVAVLIIRKINNDETVKLGAIYRESLGAYVHLVIAALISFGLVMGGFKVYGLIFQRALEIRSTTGPLFWLKAAVVTGAPYFNLLITIIITTLFIYVIPIIMLEKKKIFSALVLNFKFLFRSFWVTFLTVSMTTLLYVPVILIKGIHAKGVFHPDVGVLILILALVVMAVIDAIIYTTVVTNYLLREGK